MDLSTVTYEGSLIISEEGDHVGCPIIGHGPMHIPGYFFIGKNTPLLAYDLGNGNYEVHYDALVSDRTAVVRVEIPRTLFNKKKVKNPAAAYPFVGQWDVSEGAWAYILERGEAARKNGIYFVGYESNNFPATPATPTNPCTSLAGAWADLADLM